MPEEEWTPKQLPNFIGDPMDPGCQVNIRDLEVCPGWLVRQAAVAEAAQAHLCFDKGQLKLYYPHEENIVLECVLLMHRAWNTFETARNKKLSRK